MNESSPQPPSELPPAASFIVLNGPLDGHRFRVEDGLVIGRSTESTITLPDSKCSRRHACVESSDDHFEIVDLDSHNGLTVNGSPVRRAQLSHGDVIQIGGTEIGLLEHRFEEVPSLITSSNLAAEAVRRWTPGDPPPLASLPGHLFLGALGVHLPRPELIQEHPEFAQLVNKTRNFAVLYELSTTLERARGLDTVLSIAITYLFWVVSADRGYVLLRDPDSKELVCVLAQHRDPDQAADMLQFSRTIVELVARERTAIVSPNAAIDSRFGPTPSIERNHIGSIMCLPLLDRNEVIGVIQLDRVETGDAFSQDDLDLIQVLGSYLALRIRNAQLFEEVERQLDDVRAANQQLEIAQETLVQAERMATIGRLASGIAHEVNNFALPLGAASTVLESHPDDTELQEMVALVVQSRDNIRTVVDELWRVSKDLPPEIELQQGDLAATIESGLRVSSFDSAVRRHATELHIPDDLPPVRFDERHLLRLLINLIRNAGQAMDATGRITITVEPEDEYVAISIHDEGSGIPPELMPRIWEQFFTTKGESGMGLGLDMCRRVVEAHHGRIECDSLIGRGTTMTVRLPIAAATLPSSHNSNH